MVLWIEFFILSMPVPPPPHRALCDMWGFHGDANEECHLLGYGPVYSSRCLLMFRKTYFQIVAVTFATWLVHSYSSSLRWKECFPPKSRYTFNRLHGVTSEVCMCCVSGRFAERKNSECENSGRANWCRQHADGTLSWTRWIRTIFCHSSLEPGAKTSYGVCKI
jgi:hypothetical protein